MFAVHFLFLENSATIRSYQSKHQKTFEVHQSDQTEYLDKFQFHVIFHVNSALMSIRLSLIMYSKLSTLNYHVSLTGVFRHQVSIKFNDKLLQSFACIFHYN